MEVLLAGSAERDLLKTLPGVGKILSGVIALEIGDGGRFPSRKICPADCNTLAVP